MEKPRARALSHGKVTELPVCRRQVERDLETFNNSQNYMYVKWFKEAKQYLTEQRNSGEKKGTQIDRKVKLRKMK